MKRKGDIHTVGLLVVFLLVCITLTAVIAVNRRDPRDQHVLIASTPTQSPLTREQSARDLGRYAFKSGSPVTANPYPPDSLQAMAFVSGWYQARDDED